MVIVILAVPGVMLTVVATGVNVVVVVVMGDFATSRKYISIFHSRVMLMVPSGCAGLTSTPMNHCSRNIDRAINSRPSKIPVDQKSIAPAGI